MKPAGSAKEVVGICNDLMSSVAQVTTGRCNPLQLWGEDFEPSADARVCGFVLAMRFKPLARLKTLRDLAVCPGAGRGCSVQDVRKALERVGGRPIAFHVSPLRC